MSFCGFATNSQIEKTTLEWQKDKGLKLPQRLDYMAGREFDRQQKKIGTVGLVPQIMNVINRTEFKT